MQFIDWIIKYIFVLVFTIHCLYGVDYKKSNWSICEKCHFYGSYFLHFYFYLFCIIFITVQKNILYKEYAKNYSKNRTLKAIMRKGTKLIRSVLLLQSEFKSCVCNDFLNIQKKISGMMRLLRKPLQDFWI